MLELYKALTNALKNTIRRKYIYLFGSKRTFHRRLKSDIKKLRKAELSFFTEVGLIKDPPQDPEQVTTK